MLSDSERAAIRDPHNAAYHEARGEIDEMRKERDKARAQVELAERERDKERAVNTAWMGRTHRAEAEVDRLRIIVAGLAAGMRAPHPQMKEETK